MQQPYHFPHDRRREERRRAPSAVPPQEERRVADRRSGEVKLRRVKPQPINRGLLWAAALTVLVVVDSVCLDGAYRHVVTQWTAERATTVRSTVDHFWDSGH
ncbi:hypothetical protein [Sphingomonas beigongshangi]|uniref:hypothetical protein n=1 Tax=Sphingomonas beigongshangi TaxID=2782540 RepID=UPI00193B3FF5|nr:hypothetical protein [Sphingomonas beigongshangi]